MPTACPSGLARMTLAARKSDRAAAAYPDPEARSLRRSCDSHLSSVVPGDEFSAPRGFGSEIPMNGADDMRRRTMPCGRSARARHTQDFQSSTARCRKQNQGGVNARRSPERWPAAIHRPSLAIPSGIEQCKARRIVRRAGQEVVSPCRSSPPASSTTSVSAKRRPSGVFTVVELALGFDGIHLQNVAGQRRPPRESCPAPGR